MGEVVHVREDSYGQIDEDDEQKTHQRLHLTTLVPFLFHLLVYKIESDVLQLILGMHLVLVYGPIDNKFREHCSEQPEQGTGGTN